MHLRTRPFAVLQLLEEYIAYIAAQGALHLSTRTWPQTLHGSPVGLVDDLRVRRVPRYQQSTVSPVGRAPTSSAAKDAGRQALETSAPWHDKVRGGRHARVKQKSLTTTIERNCKPRKPKVEGGMVGPVETAVYKEKHGHTCRSRTTIVLASLQSRDGARRIFGP